MDDRTGARHFLTGTSAGRSVFVSDGSVAAVPLGGAGVSARLLGGYDHSGVLAVDATAYAAPAPMLPTPGGWRFSTLTIEAGATREYHEVIARSFGESAAGTAAGFHRTPTIDLIIVLCGEFVLELDDGAERVLRSGDTAILNGVRHRWHNRGAVAATLAAVMIGAQEKRG